MISSEEAREEKDNIQNNVIIYFIKNYPNIYTNKISNGLALGVRI